MGEELRAWRVCGRVQGVGFRYFVVREARALGLRGWVRNLVDGSVEVQAAGQAGSLGRLEEALRLGPAHARVDRVEAMAPSPSLESFRVFTIEY
jgi:acylphosphatase